MEAMNEEQVRRLMDELIVAGDKLAEHGMELSDDGQPAEAERSRQRATACYGAVVQIATAYPMPREQVIAMIRMACVAAATGAKDASSALLDRAQRLVDAGAGAEDLIRQIQTERQGLVGAMS